MQTYILKRTLLFFPTLIFVTIVVFVILRVVPGDPALMLISGEGDESGESDITEQALIDMRAKLGTDRSIVVQYADWVWGMVRLDFGMSYWWDTPVVDDLKARFPITIELTVLALLWASLLAVPLGVISAIRQDSIGDYAGRLITIAGIALPNFLIAILMVFFLIKWFEWIPPLGYENVWEDPWKNMQQLFFPAIALGFSNMAFIARITRSAMLDVFREDYIRTARSKGLREGAVVSRHALKKRHAPGGYGVRLRVRPVAGRDGDHRGHLHGSRGGPFPDRLHLPSGLSRSAGGGGDSGNDCVGLEPVA